MTYSLQSPTMFSLSRSPNNKLSPPLINRYHFPFMSDSKALILTKQSSSFSLEPFSLLFSGVGSSSTHFFVSRQCKLKTDEVETAGIFEENLPSVVHITNFGPREELSFLFNGLPTLCSFCPYLLSFHERMNTFTLTMEYPTEPLPAAAKEDQPAAAEPPKP